MAQLASWPLQRLRDAGRIALPEYGSLLDYALTATDSEMLARPFQLKSAWIWHTDEKVLPYDCVSDYQK